ncbi:MAG: metal-dependent hydrolase [Candidatus Nomurabacteria bacterium]|nr:MAG: metal-dependent hydrolase [Candidatus Nomurabacteria bacterium]
MTGKTHFLAGANAAAWTFAASLPGQEVALITLIGGVAALLPDLDASNSMLQQSSIQLGRRGPRLPLLRPLGMLLHALFGHRGLLHSLLALGIVIALTSLWQPPIAIIIAVAIGYASHLLLDGVTPSGIPLFYPWKLRVRPPKMLRIRTGGFIDQLLFVSLSLGLVLLALRILPKV